MRLLNHIRRGNFGLSFSLSAIASEDFVFQQDEARSHTSKNTFNYFEAHLPAQSELLHADYWPTNSGDINIMDFCVWGVMEKYAYNVKIRYIDHLTERLG